MKPLSKGQKDAFLRSKDGKVFVGGRGCKQQIDGLVIRGLVDRVRYAGTGLYGSADWWGKLTPLGENYLAKLKEKK